MLNGKLFPFLEMNEGSVSDYVDYATPDVYSQCSIIGIILSRYSGIHGLLPRLRENIGNNFGQFVSNYRDQK